MSSSSTITDRVRTHPGEVLREQFMRPLGLSASELARALRVPPNRVTSIIAEIEPRAVTPDTALRLARCLGTSPQFWLNLQMAHDLSTVEQAVEGRIQTEVTTLSTLAQRSEIKETLMKAKVFIGSSTTAIPIAEYAQAELAHVSLPEIWTNGSFRHHHTPIESLFLALNEFQFALFVVIPEDITTKRGQGLSTMRDNVLFEAGLFLGKLGRERVFLIAPTDTQDVTLSLPSDLTGIAPTHYDPGAANIQASISAALLQMKVALRSHDKPTQRIIFDSSSRLHPYQLIFRGGMKWNAEGTRPISNAAQGQANVTNDAVELRRTNAIGTYEIEIRPHGQGEPSIPRVAGSDRIFEVRFEGRVENTGHGVRIVLIDEKTYKWLDNTALSITGHEWASFAAVLRAAPGIDILVRIDDEIETMPSGMLFLRNISIKQFVS